MRLIHLAHYGGRYAGSFIPLLESVLRTARERGWETIAAFDESAADRGWLSLLTRSGADIRFLPTNSRREIRRRVADLLAESSGPTILHTHFATFDLPAAAAATKGPKAIVFWHVHSLLQSSVWRRARNVARFALASGGVSRVLCVSPDVVEAVRRRGCPPRKIVFFRNAIDVSRFPPITPDQRRRARARLGLAQDATMLLHFGWDWRRKGGDVFLDAVRILARDAASPIHALTVGGGEPARSECAQLGLGNVVTVLPPADAVAELYAAADLFVSPSRAEGMPFAITEALCRGLPVVATNLPGQAFQCEGLSACRLTELDPGEVAAAIESLLARTPEQAAADAHAARARVHESMDLSSYSRRLLSLYETVMHQGRSETVAATTAGTP